MSQVIFIQNEGDFQKLLEVNLEMYIGASVIPMTSAAKAIELLKKLPKADLIICPNQINQESSAMEIYKYLQKFERKIPLLVLGYSAKLAKKTYMTKESDDWRAAIRSSAKILGVTPVEIANRPVPDFYPLNLKYFRSVTSVGTDVYLKIPKKNKAEGFQFIKRFRANESYEHSLIDKYQKYGVNHLYVLKEDRLIFSDDFSKKILTKLESENLSKSERIEVSADAFYAFRDNILETGLTEESIELAEATISSMQISVNQTKGLKELLDELSKKEGDFLFNHSLMVAYVGNHVLRQLLMGTKEQQNSFTFVAFFHDITLQTDEEAMIHHQKDLEDIKGKINFDRKKHILSHANDACNLLKEYPQIPMGVPMAIKQHHCTLDGIGFIDLPGPRVNPLAQVLRVVEDYTTYILKTDGSSENRSKVLKNLSSKYKNYTYAEVVEALESLN